jgi:NADH dehydrogenase [ubiquinone] 1 alpha subcomplex assembly factor 7
MGYALLIDYAPAGEVHAYRAHRVVADVLDDPGSADITAGVDLEALAARARAWGLEAFEPVAQGAALTALGFDDWVRAELSRQGDLLNTARGSDAVRTWEGRNRARLLVDPSALGRLRWLVLATTGLPAPRWLSEAARDGGA